MHPLPFLTDFFIANAVCGSDREFGAGLALLKQQTHIPLRGNAGLLFKDQTPIAFAVTACGCSQSAKERTAEVIDALYRHCGIPTTRRGPHPSPLWQTVMRMNLPAFDALLLRCEATFDPRDLSREFPSVLHYLAARGDDALPFLDRIKQVHTKLDAFTDPNAAALGGCTALHAAVSSRVVRTLMDAFGADPTICNAEGLRPVDTLTKAKKCAASDTEECERLLTHEARTTAVLMGVCLESRNQHSELRHLDCDLAALVLSFHQRPGAANQTSAAHCCDGAR